MSDDKKTLTAGSIEQLRERLKEAEASVASGETKEVTIETELTVEAEPVAEEDTKPMAAAEPAPVIEVDPFVISDEDRKELPFVSNGLLFVVCGTSERGFNLGRIVQIIPVDDDAQCVLVYDMKTEENPFITQIVQHRVADIRKALS